MLKSKLIKKVNNNINEILFLENLGPQKYKSFDKLQSNKNYTHSKLFIFYYFRKR
jgi:hypothetical protein